MSRIEDILDTLENSVSKLLHTQDVLKQTNAKLMSQLQESQQKVLDYQKEITVWSEKYETLKVANAMLGSDENKRETKLKINTLIREIDYCITQLSK